jgi:uncharacterized repeat protein (TIGR01451 family)
LALLLAVLAGGLWFATSRDTASAVQTTMPDLDLSKRVLVELRPGQPAVYSIVVTNEADDGFALPPITVTDTLPAELRFTSFSGEQWNCGAAGQIVTCTFAGTLGPGQSTTLLLSVLVSDSVSAEVENIACVAVAGEVDPSDNCGTALGQLPSPSPTPVPVEGGGLQIQKKATIFCEAIPHTTSTRATIGDLSPRRLQSGTA